MYHTNGKNQSSSAYATEVGKTDETEYYKTRGEGGRGRNFFECVVYAALALLLVAMFAVLASGCSSAQKREPLAAGSVTETAYYTDADGGWIADASVLEAGMKDFYEYTGVQPYLYILPNGQTENSEDLSTMASEMYDQLFTDEGHFLVVFCDNNKGEYNLGYTIGTEAKKVLDDAALKIFNDTLNKNYQNTGLSESQMLGDTYAESGKAIMELDAL